MTFDVETSLEEANRLVYGNRGADYGHPAEDFGCVQAMFQAYYLRKYGRHIPLEPVDHAVYMMFVKLAREAHKPKRDNLVDTAGYIGTAQMCREYAEAHLLEETAFAQTNKE